MVVLRLPRPLDLQYRVSTEKVLLLTRAGVNRAPAATAAHRVARQDYQIRTVN